MPKIAFIGAGSRIFATTLISDVLSYPSLADSTITLMDIDEERLASTADVAEDLAAVSDGNPTIEATTDRREALTDADYVLTMINVGGVEPFENEIRIPEKYGVEQAIGDTLGPGGIFRSLRTIPHMLEIARDMEEVCPDALMLNYTNPMAILCWAIDEATDVEVVGLCHSVPHTAAALADYVDVPKDEVEYWVAGINHMAWFLELEHDGRDLYPDLYEAMEDEAVYEQDTVRFELMRHFGAFVTESSGHLSEYVPYFRTDPDLIEELHGTAYARRMRTASYLETWTEQTKARQEGTEEDAEEPVIERSNEYASRIIHSLETDETRRLNLNVSNETNAISNLPSDACVEVPCLIDGTGIHPCTVGALPPQLAALDRTNVNVQELAVRGALDGDRDAVHHAVKLDPLTAAVLSLDEIHAMTEELIESNEAYLPDLT